MTLLPILGVKSLENPNCGREQAFSRQKIWQSIKSFMLSKLLHRFQPNFAQRWTPSSGRRGWPQQAPNKFKMADGRHFKKLLNCHISGFSATVSFMGIDIVSHGRWFKRKVLVFGNLTRFLRGDGGQKLQFYYKLAPWTHWIRDATISLFNRTRQMARTVSVQQQRTGDQSHCDPSEHLQFRSFHLTNSKIIILLLESKRPKVFPPSRDLRAQDVGLPKCICGRGSAPDRAGRAYRTGPSSVS